MSRYFQHSLSLALMSASTLFALSPLSMPAQGLPQDKAIGPLEVVTTFNGPMPTGVTVSHNHRIFVSFPRWGDFVPFTVAEIVHGKAVAYPNVDVNDWPGLETDHPDVFGMHSGRELGLNQTHFVSVQSVVIDPANRLWVLDSGAPMLKTALLGGPKLVCIDLATNKIIKWILLPQDVASRTSYMNDVRFDLRVGTPAGADGIQGTAYVTDSSSEGPNGIVVIDLASGASWRKLNNHPSTRPEPDFVTYVMGRPFYKVEYNLPPRAAVFGVDSLAISPDGSRLFYCPISSNKLYSVSTEALRNRSLSKERVADTIHLVAGKEPSDGLESDAAGNIYATDPTSGSILKISPAQYVANGYVVTTLVHDPRLLWPDTLSLSDDGYLYITVNQLYNQPSMHNGKDLRQKPYVLFRMKLGAKPIRLK